MRLAAAIAPGAIVCMAFASPALAQATLPTRDVTVSYRVAGDAHQAVPGGLPDSVRVAWSAGEQRLRVEPQGRAQFLLVDLGATAVQVIDSSLRSVLDLPVKPRDLDPIRLQGATLTQAGRATIAGLPCTDYAVQSPRGHGTVCLTGDGVALRAQGEVNGRSGSFTATAVNYGRVPDAAFAVPQGYMQLALPRGLNLPPGLHLPPGLGATQ